MATMQRSCSPGRYLWGGNAGSHGIKFETNLAYALFVSGSLQRIPFRLATEMREAGKWEDVVLFRDDLKEVWLFQAKHGDRIGDVIRFGDLFPDDCEGRKEFALHMYLHSMLACRRKVEFEGFKMRFFLFTNKVLSDRTKLEMLMKIETRTVDGLMQWNNHESCRQGLKPQELEIETLKDMMNIELLAIKDAIINLLENGKVSDVLVKYKTPLKSVLRISEGRVHFTDDFTRGHHNATYKWLFEELQKHFSWNKDDGIKTLTGKPINSKMNQPIKVLFEGNSRDKCFPILASEQDVRDFFAHFELHLRQPDPKAAVDELIYSWMRQWIPPNVLGKFSEAQMTLPRTKFYETFKSWHELIEKEKDFLSFDVEGKQCIHEIIVELKQHMPMRSNRCYIPRYIEEDKLQEVISEEQFLSNYGSNKSYVLIGEPGMGKTTWMEHIAFGFQKTTDMKVHLIYLNKLHGKSKNGYDNAFEILRSELSELNLRSLETDLKSGAKQIMILLDGFDELADSCQALVIRIIHQLMSLKNVYLIVSGRRHKQKHLEFLLKTKAICLVPFKYEEQIEFLKAFWGVPKDDLEMLLKFRNFAINLIEKLHDNIKAEYFSLTGLPLITRMLAEVYADDFQKFIISNQTDTDHNLLSITKLSLLNLFEQFTSMALNMQMKKILNQDAYSTLHVNIDRRFKLNIGQFDVEHQLAAIKQLAIREFPTCVKNHQYLPSTLEFMKRLQDGEERSLLITISRDNRIEFVHRSYAEYFVAKYLYENATECEIILLKILQRHKVVQIFFFMMVEENFAASSQQIMTIENICKRDSDVAFLACSGDNVKIVKKLLENQNANTMRTHFKGTLLHAAAKAGSYDVVSLLLLDNCFKVRPKAKNKAHKMFQILHSMFTNTSTNLNSQDGEGCTPIFLATRNGHLRIVKKLLNHYADVDIPNHDKQSPVHMAYRCGHVEIFQLLLEKSKNLNFTDDRGKTLLHWAATNGDLETVSTLLSLSVNIDIRDAVGWTPLNYAVDTGGYKTAEIILTHSPNVNTLDERGRTPLHWVALSGKVDIGKLLVDHKANIDALDNDGCTPLHLSYTFRNLAMINMLISHSANINIPNILGQTLLHLASKKGDLEVVRMLLNYSANVNTSDKFGWTPLHFATANGYFEIINLLIKASANVNVPTQSGQTCLLIAARTGQSEVVRILIDHSAVHTPDRKMQTALHLAAKNGHLEVVRMLLAQRLVNVNATDEDGWTALHYAVDDERKNLVELLLSNSAWVTIRTRDGLTPVDLAVTKGNKLLRDLLVEKHEKEECSYA
ncbi:AAEL008117-PA [Aedes aegypti]|uniref:Uncharacterized protein n=2 Tax=Aedes aegypti TaxID=7159 RepID=Q0IEQ8_AEDAE|nr:uncharacterized protein LOC5570144 [Aedes aegypti]EAT40147.1 AAEL008117-PA [Aedes aegypti]